MEIEKQRLLVSALVQSRDLLAVCNGIVKPSYFDPTLKKSVDFVKEYFTKYKDVPRVEVLRAETGIILPEIGEVSKAESKFLADEIEEFCRNRAMTEAVLKSPELIQKGEFGKVLEALKEAVAVGLVKDLGMDYFDDPETRLQNTLVNQAKISTGWPELDDLIGGGLGRQELIMFAANSGGGKSMTMLNLAKNLLAQGLNGVYISLEMSEGSVSKRLDSMISMIGQDALLKEIHKVAASIQNASKKMGQFFIKRMPEDRTNANTIRSYLQQLVQTTGIQIDFIVVDYLDILGTSLNVSLDNMFIKDKYVATELRSLGFDYDAIMISASQLGRCLAIDSLVILENGSVKQIVDIEVGDRIKTSNGYNTVLNKTKIMYQQLFEVKTESGKSLKMSRLHTVPVYNEFGDFIAERDIACSLRAGNFVLTDCQNRFVALDEIIEIAELEIEATIDIEVDGNNLFFANGVLVHNSAIDAEKQTQAHIQGGISKINTSDNTIGIKQDDLMRAAGEIAFTGIKTRNAPGTGITKLLGWDPVSLNISSLKSTAKNLTLKQPFRKMNDANPLFEKTSISDGSENKGIFGLMNA